MFIVKTALLAHCNTDTQKTYIALPGNVVWMLINTCTVVQFIQLWMHFLFEVCGCGVNSFPLAPIIRKPGYETRKQVCHCLWPNKQGSRNRCESCPTPNIFWGGGNVWSNIISIKCTPACGHSTLQCCDPCLWVEFKLDKSHKSNQFVVLSTSSRAWRNSSQRFTSYWRCIWQFQ